MESGEIVLSESATHAQLIDSMMDSESVPSGTRTPLQYIRYDKYTANEHVTPHAFVAVPGYAEDYHRKTVGRVTATKTRVLGTDQWITSTIYYDSKCRPMQEITDNLVGGVTRVTHSYDFVGNVVKSQEAHGANTLKYAYTYDDRSRLLNVTASFNGATPVTMKTLEYDEVGRLKKVNLHNNTTSSEYDYNIRSWLTGITGSKFSQSLSYGNGNGNIRSMNWSADGSSHSYAFTYDGANRMLDAIHGTGDYTEKVMSYDKNGNILGLQRYGGSLIDNLTYSYDGNQLTQVEDATGNSAGFSNGASTTNEYTYDYNGNLTKDSNKGISNISWNSLNLPNVVTFEDGSTVTYTYAADGTKLRTVHNINGTTTQKDYCGSVIYENGTAKLWQTEAGYISMNDSKYHYYLQDHQGNNRVVVSETGATEEVNHYYAFGGLFDNSNSVQPFKYNGKELDTHKGLNWYDYGARQYDATLGRWFAVDPLAEKYYESSPYNYCDNNPALRIDHGGEFWDVIWDVANFLYDIGAAIVDHVKGDHEQAQSHWQDAGADAVAMLIPGIPAGVTKLRYADDVVDTAKAFNKSENVVDVAKTAETSRAARRESMRGANIPTSQQPIFQSKNESGWEYIYETFDPKGKIEIKSVQQQTLDRSHKEQPHWEAGSVKKDTWGNPSFNRYGRTKLKSNKSKVYYGK